MINLKAGELNISINEFGNLSSMSGIRSEVEYLPKDVQVPLVRVCKGNYIYNPIKCEELDDYLVLSFEQVNTKVKLDVKEENKYITFEVIDVTGDKISTLLWGPYATTVNETIGEIIGVVRDKEFGIGIQALNIKTIAGWPTELRNMVFDESEGRNLFERSVDGIKYHECTAAPTSFGSVLQCFCRDRSEKEIRKVWDAEKAEVLPLQGEDGVIIGSKIALFGGKTEDILEIISDIEVEQGLPHPIVNGQWVKTSRECMGSYLITDITDKNIDEVIDYAKKGGFKYIYHSDPFVDWGHFNLRRDHFTNGDESLKECVDKANEEGIGVGVHTLSSFTTVKDPYITPKPHKNLAKVGSAKIIGDIDKETTKIKVDNKDYFVNKGFMSTVVIDDELIKYGNVEEKDGEYYLTNCERGAFGTEASCHSCGDIIGKLWDHAYKVFFPDIELQNLYTKRLVDLFNNTGLRQISFDGLEGCLSTGHEEYAMTKMMDDCFRGWENEVINDSSRLQHYSWHIHTRTNWGEPWGESMREGQVDLRIKNQKFYERNLFPRMLGWFLVRLGSRKFEATSLEDIEWALSEAAGFDGGFSLCIDHKVLKKLGNIDTILNSVKAWEEARMSNLFSNSQKERLRNPKTEWHLEKEDEGKFNLYPMEISKVYKCDPEELQPGQPGGADWNFTNNFKDQPLKLRLRVLDGDGYIENPSFILRTGTITFETTIDEKQYLLYDGKDTAGVYDKNYNLIKTVKVTNPGVIVEAGSQGISFACDFEGDDEKPEVNVKFFTYGDVEMVEN